VASFSLARLLHAAIIEFGQFPTSDCYVGLRFLLTLRAPSLIALLVSPHVCLVHLLLGIWFCADFTLEVKINPVACLRALKLSWDFYGWVNN
jgi:hypothetical protein